MANCSPPPLSIEKGTCDILFAYDIARSIDLDEAERHIMALKHRETIRHRRRAPKYFEYRPPPLRVTQAVEPIVLGAYCSEANIDLVLYDFGAVLVVYKIPFRGCLSGLLTLSNALYDSVLLLNDSRQQVEQLLAAARSAIFKPNIADFVEDYAIFHIESFTTACDVSELCTTYAHEIAQILRAEPQVLSPQEVSDALAYRLSYGATDVTVVDWNAALLVDPAGEDVRAVLEFANVELLEMRYLDRRLDAALDRSYEALSKQRRRARQMLLSHRGELSRMAQMQVDSAVLFEGVNNALKLLGDQYLSRVYRLVSQRFHLAEWDTGILRKLQILESIYDKMTDQATNRRMEVLEWIIIFLIAASMVLSLIPGGIAH
jgi:hypothetical protein